MGSEAPVLCVSRHALPLQVEQQPQDPILKAGSILTPFRARCVCVWGGWLCINSRKKLTSQTFLK